MGWLKYECSGNRMPSQVRNAVEYSFEKQIFVIAAVVFNDELRASGIFLRERKQNSACSTSKKAGVEWALADKAASKRRHSASGLFLARARKEGRAQRGSNMSKIRERNRAVQHLKNALAEKGRVSDLGGHEQAEFPSRSLNKSPLAENQRSTRLPLHQKAKD